MQTLENTEAIQPGITWLNMSGDVTITWDDKSREDIIQLVQKKMNEGYSFFIITPRSLPFLGNKKIALKKESQLQKAVGVVIEDNQVQQIIGNLGDTAVEEAVRNGKAHVASPPKAKLAATTRAKTAQEVVKHQTVAVRQIVGG